MPSVTSTPIDNEFPFKRGGERGRNERRQQRGAHVRNGNAGARHEVPTVPLKPPRMRVANTKSSRSPTRNAKQPASS